MSRGGGGGGCVVMEGPPSAVVTHRGGIHGDPLSHWKTSGEKQGTYFTEGEGEGEQSGQLALIGERSKAGPASMW